MFRHENLHRPSASYLACYPRHRAEWLCCYWVGCTGIRCLIEQTVSSLHAAWDEFPFLLHEAIPTGRACACRRCCDANAKAPGRGLGTGLDELVLLAGCEHVEARPGAPFWLNIGHPSLDLCSQNMVRVSRGSRLYDLP